MTDVVVITSDNFPVLFRAFETISHDCGRQAGHKNYAVPMSYEKDLPTINEFLRRLTNEQLETLCIGEQTEAQKLLTNAGLKMADELLQRFFEEFR